MKYLFSIFILLHALPLDCSEFSVDPNPAPAHRMFELIKDPFACNPKRKEDEENENLAAIRLLCQKHPETAIGINAEGITPAQALFLAAVANYEAPEIHSIASYEIRAIHRRTKETKMFVFPAQKITSKGHDAAWHFPFGIFAHLIWAGFDPTKRYEGLSFFELAKTHKQTPGVHMIIERTHAIHEEYRRK